MSDGCPNCLPLHGLRLPHTSQPRLASLVIFDQSDPIYAALQPHGHLNMIVDVFRLRGLAPFNDVVLYGVLLPTAIITCLVQHMVVRPLSIVADQCHCIGAHLLVYIGHSSQYLVPLLGYYNDLTTRLLCHCGCSCTCHASPRASGLSSTGMFWSQLFTYLVFFTPSFFGSSRNLCHLCYIPSFF